MNMQVQGRIHTAFPAEQVTQRFKKREFVLELDAASRYPQLVIFQLTGDRCDSLDDFEVDDIVSVEFSLRGREWKSPKGETRYFNSLEVWSIASRGRRAARAAVPSGPAAPGRVVAARGRTTSRRRIRTTTRFPSERSERL